VDMRMKRVYVHAQRAFAHSAVAVGIGSSVEGHNGVRVCESRIVVSMPEVLLDVSTPSVFLSSHPKGAVGMWLVVDIISVFET